MERNFLKERKKVGGLEKKRGIGLKERERWYG